MGVIILFPLEPDVTRRVTMQTQGSPQCGNLVIHWKSLEWRLGASCFTAKRQSWCPTLLFTYIHIQLDDVSDALMGWWERAQKSRCLGSFCAFQAVAEIQQSQSWGGPCFQAALDSFEHRTDASFSEFSFLCLQSMLSVLEDEWEILGKLSVAISAPTQWSSNRPSVAAVHLWRSRNCGSLQRRSAFHSRSAPAALPLFCWLQSHRGVFFFGVVLRISNAVEKSDLFGSQYSWVFKCTGSLNTCAVCSKPYLSKCLETAKD